MYSCTLCLYLCVCMCMCVIVFGESTEIASNTSIMFSEKPPLPRSKTGLITEQIKGKDGLYLQLHNSFTGALDL